MKKETGLAAVGECALAGGFRATVLTRPVVVIDVAVLVVTSVWDIDTVVVLGQEGVECSVGRVFDGGHVLVDDGAVDVVRARTGYQVLGHVIDGDGVLVGCGILVALVGGMDKSGGMRSLTENR
jgi:hypothetical protein